MVWGLILINWLAFFWHIGFCRVQVSQPMFNHEQFGYCIFNFSLKLVYPGISVCLISLVVLEIQACPTLTFVSTHCLAALKRGNFLDFASGGTMYWLSKTFCGIPLENELLGTILWGEIQCSSTELLYINRSVLSRTSRGIFGWCEQKKEIL